MQDVPFLNTSSKLYFIRGNSHCWSNRWGTPSGFGARRAFSESIDRYLGGNHQVFESLEICFNIDWTLKGGISSCAM